MPFGTMHMNITKKLVIGYVLIVLVAGVIGIVGVRSIDALTRQQQDNYQLNSVPIGILGIAGDHYQQIRIDLMNAVLAKDKDAVEKFAADVRNDHKSVADKLAEIQGTIRSSALKKVYGNVITKFNDYAGWEDKLLGLAREHKTREALDIIQSEAYQKTSTEIRDGLIKLKEIKITRTKERTMESEAMGGTHKWIMITLLLVSMVCAVVLAVSLAGIISRPLREAVSIANDLAGGNLTMEVTVKSQDETGQLMTAMKNMVQNLRDMISKTVNISTGITAASTQLHSISVQIATGAEEVVCQINTVATASEEMSATSCDIARSCTMAAQASHQTAESAGEGVKVVNETIAGMAVIAERVRQTAQTIGALGSRSDQIGAIVGTIEDIADQTNLLALNAAIEAARAGEQGRGFAVVADEVRALAERTTKATSEIGEMIKAIQNETREAVVAMEQSVHEVEKGAVSSQKSGQALENILERINEVTMQVNQIATAAEEQSATTGEVTSNIQQITEVINHTARGADETAGEAAQLATRVRDLQLIVGRFRLA